MEDLQRQINELKAEIEMLKADTTIPFNVEQAFRSRLRIQDLAELASSSKTAASETQAVNEAGVGSYNVAKPPDGFREYVVGGTTLYIPYYT